MDAFKKNTNYIKITETTTAIIEPTLHGYNVFTIYEDAEERFCTMPKNFKTYEEAENKVRSLIVKFAK